MGGQRQRAAGCLGVIWKQRDALLALVIGLWLAFYWLVDGWHHGRLLLWLVVPLMLLNSGRLVQVFRGTRWLWALAALLSWQALTRTWAVQPEGAVGTFSDCVAVLALMVSLVAVGRHHNAGPWTVAGLSILSAFIAVFSLAAFYGWGGNSFAEDRLRNPLVYENGLNPVLTGMLFGFGALGAAWFSRREDWGMRRLFWLATLLVLIFGLMATQSRAPMLAFGAGFAVLLFFERLRLWRAVLTASSAVVLFFGVLFGTRGSEAATDLVERGSTGRLSIYRWFLQDMGGPDFVVGKGMGTPAVIPEVELGWFVHHPHSSYLCQLYLTGLVGLALLLWVLGWAGRCARREALRQDAVWLALLASGAVAVLFDGAQIFSLASVPRIEFLLVAVPAAMVVGKVANDEASGGGDRSAP